MKRHRKPHLPPPAKGGTVPPVTVVELSSNRVGPPPKKLLVWTETGIVEVPNPDAASEGTRRADATGSAVK